MLRTARYREKVKSENHLELCKNNLDITLIEQNY